MSECVKFRCRFVNVKKLGEIKSLVKLAAAALVVVRKIVSWL